MSQTTPAAVNDNSARKIESCATPRQKAMSTKPIWSRVDRRAVTANKRYQIFRGFRAVGPVDASFAPHQSRLRDRRHRSQLVEIDRDRRRRDARCAQVEQSDRRRAAKAEHRRVFEPPDRRLIRKPRPELLDLRTIEQRIRVYAALAE